MLTLARARADLVARLVVGSLLLLPAGLALGLACWYPALHTLSLSLQTAVLDRPARFAGLANYLQLWQDADLGPALIHSALAALARLAAVVPAGLVGWLWSRQPRRWRRLARLGLGIGVALSSPAALGLLWRLAGQRLGLLAGPEATLWTNLGLEFVAFLGFGGALTATAILLLRPATGRQVKGLCGLAAIVAVASGLGTFSLPFVATGGGPNGRTLTAGLHLYRAAFQEMRLGQAAAESGLLLAASAGLGLLFGLLLEGLGLRLAPTRLAAPARPSWRRLVAGLLGLGLLVLPVLLPYLWGAGLATLAPGRPLDEARVALELGLSLFNGSLVPGLAILLVQLPTAYLAALSLTLVRPFGALGSRVAFALLLAGTFVPPVVAGLGFYDAIRQLCLYNTLPALALPLAAGPASLCTFRLFFKGQEAAIGEARRQGDSAPTAFRKHLLGPSLAASALAGVLALLLAGQSLAWPLLALASSDLFPLSLRVVVHQLQFAGSPATLAAAAWLAGTCWGLGALLLWWLAQALALERLELVAE